MPQRSAFFLRSRNKRHLWRILCWLIVAAPLFFLPSSTSKVINAQTDTNYWQFSVTNPISHLHPVDIDRDGIQEFIVASEDGEINLIGADGLPIWQYQTDAPVYSIWALNANGSRLTDSVEATPQPSTEPLEIIVANQNQLSLLTSDGRLLWEYQIQPTRPSMSDFATSSLETVRAQTDQLEANPRQLLAIDQNQDGREEIVLLLESGQVQLIDGDGFLIWEYARNTTPGQGNAPLIAVDDLNKDGRDEIVLTTFRRFSQLTVLDENGGLLWDQPLAISGRITALELIDFPQLAGVNIAIGTDKGVLNLYNAARQRVWPRTLNVPITALAVTELRDGPALMVGTAVGTVTAFNWEGQRIWSTPLDESAAKPIVNLTGLPFLPDERQPSVSAVLGNEPNIDVPKDVVLLSSNGRVLDIRNNTDSIGLTQLSDVNKDTNLELILARFSNIELVGIGIGANETTSEWRQSVNAVPQTLLKLDLNLDGNEELIIGTQNGRVYCINNSSELCWLQAPGGSITHLAALDTISGFQPNIVVVRQEIINESGSIERIQSHLEVWQSNGARVWTETFQKEITALLVQNINERTQSEIIVGTEDGEIQVFSSSQAKLWAYRLPIAENTPISSNRIQEFLALPNNITNEVELLAVTPQALHKVNALLFSRKIWQYSDGTIQKVYLVGESRNELATRIITLMNDGSIRGHHWDGIQLPQWPFRLNGNIVQSLPANDIITEAFQESPANGFLVGTANSDVIRFDVQDNQPSLIWELENVGDIAGFYWGDLDGDSIPDMAVGTEESSVYLYANGNQDPLFLNRLTLSGRTFALTGLNRVGNQSDLIAITTNGEIELFRAQENRPPLLTKPVVESTNNGYDFSIDVLDVENDLVEVELEVFDSVNNNQWVSQGSSTTNGNPAVWSAVVLPDADTVRYRYRFNDGIYSGILTPPSISLEQPSPVLTNSAPFISTIVGAAFLFAVFLYARQTQLPSARAARFYRRLQSQPYLTLKQIEKRYLQLKGSEDFLLNLAQQGRQNQNEPVTNLADGLYLLPERPIAGLPIILNAIESVQDSLPKWIDIDRWSAIYKTSFALLDAPTITELSLLRPQLVQLLQLLNQDKSWSPTLDSLLPILTNIRDSQRVDQADDKLLYLNEAVYHAQELELALPEFSDRIEKTLTAVILRRWTGLLSAEIQELRGRAELKIILRTRRLAPEEILNIVINLENIGRANAEDIRVTLQPDPAYTIVEEPQLIPILPAGRNREISFQIRPLVSDRFRIGVKTTFGDQIQQKRETVFGDMVSLLPPQPTFTKVANPYLPGTPLRPHSNIFFGRDQLFNFIANNATGWSQRNVLILIGQRRTGKTSTLLRLEERLPKQLLPIYIDCQSLGVMPGMPALFHELAWLISDALLNRNIDINVPDLPEWETDPRGMFQRQFMPKVRQLLPEGTMILLVFDEFEAFEHLVNDGILPTTFFTYLRHLMQHSEGLAFLFVGTRRLEEMSADYWSILFNIALYERINYLSYRSATRLITEPVSPQLVYDDLALDKIWRVTAGHPYFLQLVCYTLVKQANDNQNAYITISDVNAGLDEMLNLGEVHFAYIWQRSTFAEKGMLTAVAHLMSDQVTFYPSDLIQFLQPYNIFLSPAEVTTALTSLVERDIFQEISPDVTSQYELRVGLVGLWVAKHKSLTKLQAVPFDEEKHPLNRRLNSEQKQS